MARAILLVLLYIFVLRAHAADPVKEFEALVARASTDSAGTWVYFASGINKWARAYAAVTDVRYDVKKSDSLVTPVTAIVTFSFRSVISPRFDTEGDAEKTSEVDQAVPARIENVTLRYGWRDDKWVYAGGERVVRHDFKGSSPIRIEETAETIAKQPRSRLRFWVP